MTAWDPTRSREAEAGPANLDRDVAEAGTTHGTDRPGEPTTD